MIALPSAKNRLTVKTSEAQKAGKKLFCAFLTLGFPNLKMTEACIWECEKAGVDILELGFPFSDPLADGPTIQKASEKSIAGGVRIQHAFQLIKKMRRQGLKMPVVFFTYLNPVLNFGFSQFVKQAKRSGFDALLVPDLPMDEEKGLQALCKKEKLSLVFLIAPTTPLARAREIAKTSSDFIYYVSLRGVTGARAALSKDLDGHLQEVRRLTRKPVLVGFGVSKPEQAKKVAGLSDGVIVGSAFIQALQKPRSSAAALGRLAAKMIRAVRSAKSSV